MRETMQNYKEMLSKLDGERSNELISKRANRKVGGNV